ncbi:superinfection immunity protein [Bacteroidota bacterium]
MSSSDETALIIALIILGIIVHFIPAYVAYNRKKKNRAAILILNIFLGWTLLGWVGALVWAMTKDKE